MLSYMQIMLVRNIDPFCHYNYHYNIHIELSYSLSNSLQVLKTLRVHTKPTICSFWLGWTYYIDNK